MQNVQVAVLLILLYFMSECLIAPFTNHNQTVVKKSDNTSTDLEQHVPWWKQLISNVPSLSDRFIDSTLGKRNLAMTIRSGARVCSVVLPVNVLQLLDVPQNWAKIQSNRIK